MSYRYIETVGYNDEFVKELEYKVKQSVTLQDIISYGKSRIANGGILGFYIADDNNNVLYKNADVKIMAY